jgi:hypothetical protein
MNRTITKGCRNCGEKNGSGKNSEYNELNEPKRILKRSWLGNCCNFHPHHLPNAS